MSEKNKIFKILQVMNWCTRYGELTLAAARFMLTTE
jgi:hypothetical protein